MKIKRQIQSIIYALPVIVVVLWLVLSLFNTLFQQNCNSKINTEKLNKAMIYYLYHS